VRLSRRGSLCVKIKASTLPTDRGADKAEVPLAFASCPWYKNPMATLTLPKSVKQVVVLGHSAGAAAPVVVYGADTQEKGSKWLRPIEKGRS